MLKIGAIVWGVKNIPRSIEFWSAALDYELLGEQSDNFAILVPKNGEGVELSFNKVTSEKAKRHHMDLFAENQSEEVERLIGLGATRVDWNYEPNAGYIVLADPDGNTFCVLQI